MWLCHLDLQSWRAHNSMAAIFWVMSLSLLIQGCLCSVEQTGCMIWTSKGENVCCQACHPGYRMVKECGPSAKDLCTACKAGTFSGDPKSYRCFPCTQCVGAQVYVKQCTATADTQCGCKEGLTCGDEQCSFCFTKCGKGQEPTEKRSCRTCPDGTFNDQIHQRCKPWSTKCPYPDQEIVAMGDAFTDIKCVNVSRVRNPKQPDPTEQTSSLALFVVISVVVLMAFGIIIIIIAMKVFQKRKDERKKPIPKTPIIRTSTDDPKTLIAIECSFHEAQQEQGSSSESLDSKDSSDQLIA